MLGLVLPELTKLLSMPKRYYNPMEDNMVNKTLIMFAASFIGALTGVALAWATANKAIKWDENPFLTAPSFTAGATTQ